MFTKNCSECNNLSAAKYETKTLVGYSSPKGHNHDDNCIKREYVCKGCGNIEVISIINKCHCGWTGKTECFCCPDGKVDEWPKNFK